MVNFTQERNTVKSSPTIYMPQQVSNVPAGAIIYAGLAYATDANQRCVNPGAAGLPVLGVAKKTYDNSLGANDAIRAEFETGIFQFDNAGDIGVDDINKTCYFSDNHTVTLVNTNSLGGKVLEVGAGFVEVGIGAQYQ